MLEQEKADVHAWVKRIGDRDKPTGRHWDVEEPGVDQAAYKLGQSFMSLAGIIERSGYLTHCAMCSNPMVTDQAFGDTKPICCDCRQHVRHELEADLTRCDEPETGGK